MLNALIEKPNYAARIGGDEFAILLPATDVNAGEAMMDAIQQLVEINNQFYPGSPLSFSMGAATSRPGERLEATAKRADLVMFEAKRKHYADSRPGPRGARRRPPPEIDHRLYIPLVPAKAGTQFLAKNWMPAFAGMSGECLCAGGSNSTRTAARWPRAGRNPHGWCRPCAPPRSG